MIVQCELMHDFNHHPHAGAGDRKMLKMTANKKKAMYPTMHIQKRGSLRSALS